MKFSGQCMDIYIFSGLIVVPEFSSFNFPFCTSPARRDLHTGWNSISEAEICIKTTNIRVIFALSIPPHPTLAPPHISGRRPLSRSLDFASTVCASSLGSISAALSGRASELFLFREEEGRRKAAREEGPSDRRLSLFEILPRDPSPEKRPRPHLRERRKSRVEWSRRQHVHSSFIKLIK